jgi:hypothetical protein
MHCQVWWDDNDEDFEFDEFYEFTAEPTTRFVTEMNEFGELVLNDGSIIGTRELAVYYKQRFRNETSQDLTRQAYLRSRESTLSSTALVPVSSSVRSQLSVSNKSLLAPSRKAKEVEDKTLAARKALQNKLKLGLQSNRLQRHYRCQVLM